LTDATIANVTGRRLAAIPHHRAQEFKAVCV
jgi:hypothetical protein